LLIASRKPFVRNRPYARVPGSAVRRIHARFVIDDLRAGTRFVTAISEASDAAERRIAAAMAAGAVIVDDNKAPGTTVLADPEGNKVCVGTFQPTST
jgi:hypothetical protein